MIASKSNLANLPNLCPFSYEALRKGLCSHPERRISICNQTLWQEERKGAQR